MAVSNQKQEAKNPLLQLALIATVFVPLAWVIVFNILSAHKGFRDAAFPKFESTYFSGKNGARVFSHMGVFYLWIGAASLSLLAWGAKLPKPAPAWVQTMRVPFFGMNKWTRLEAAALFFFVAFQVATFAVRIDRKYEPNWPRAEMWYEIAKTLGKTVCISFIVVLLPVSKSCFWWDLFNIRFERAIKFHTFVSYFIVFVVLAHSAAAFASFAISGQVKACMIPSEGCTGPENDNSDPLATSRLILYGWIALVVMIPICITSLPWFRRNKFEWFYYTHFLFIPFLLLAHLHYDSMIYYSAPGLAAYTLDKVLMMCAAKRPVQLVNLYKPTPGFVRLLIAVEPGHAFEPGQWVRINVPAVSVLQWHPMSISSSASGGSNNTITIDIKILGDWSQAVSDLADRFDPANCYTHTAVFLDGFHGSSHTEMQSYLSHSTILMVGGGIGVTPLMSSLRTLVQQKKMESDNQSSLVAKKVVFVWVVPNERVLDLYRSDLARIQAAGTIGDCDIQVVVHVTNSTPVEDKQINDSDSSSSMQKIVAKSPTDPSQPQSNKHLEAAPFMQQVMGYGHKLVLLLGAGGGFLLGLFVANLAAIDKDWQPEWHFLLQLVLAIGFSANASFMAMGSSWFRPPPPPFHATGHGGDATTDETATMDDEETVAASELQFVERSRPNIEALVSSLKDWCTETECATVGVGVCGPDSLTLDVMQASKKFSSSTVQFVLDEEAFEW